MTIAHLLVVDDDSEMREMLTDFLRRSGFHVMPAAGGAEIITHLEQSRIDLILLDVMLGDESGVEICAMLRREHDMPIILLSALSADHQVMAGYEVGADDYIAKPFNPDLLLARVRAVLKRARRTPSLVYRRQARRYLFDGWSYDGRRDEAQSPEGFQVALSRRETELLKVLLANPQIPLSREEIAAALDMEGEGDDVSGRAIDVLVGRLRGKIERNPRDPHLLKTLRGTGYVLAADVTVQDA